MDDPLRVVSTAVAPVVMVSATAILISGVNTRYISISDRVRSLAREYRSEGVSPARKSNICSQLVVFRHRMKLVSWASRLLFAAVACFIAVTVVICVSMMRATLPFVAFPIFVAGVSLVAMAIVLQLMEIHESHKTIDMEASEILCDIERNPPAQ